MAGIASVRIINLWKNFFEPLVGLSLRVRSQPAGKTHHPYYFIQGLSCDVIAASGCLHFQRFPAAGDL